MNICTLFLVVSLNLFGEVNKKKKIETYNAGFLPMNEDSVGDKLDIKRECLKISVGQGFQ